MDDPALCFLLTFLLFGSKVSEGRKGEPRLKGTTKTYTEVTSQVYADRKGLSNITTRNLHDYFLFLHSWDHH